MFEVMPYKETGTYILKSPDEASQLLDDHIVMTQSMAFSPYKKPFEERISKWESKLKMTQVSQSSCRYYSEIHMVSYFWIVCLVCMQASSPKTITKSLCVTVVFCWQEVLEEWLICQRSWLYTEPIFSSDDINRQLPVEGKRYLTMERTWRKIMKAAHDNNKVSMVRLLNHTIFDLSVVHQRIEI